MKLKYPALLILGIVTLGTTAVISRAPEKGLVVHEWGTFTSVQGGDGNLLNWKPVVTAELPGFVYDWSHAGLGRLHYNAPIQLANGQVLFTKGSMATLQRMETPVVYFYSDKAMTVDLAVQFPHGSITEWYPQASQIGPSYVPPAKGLTSLDSAIHKCGISPRVSLASTFGQKPITNSLIHWSGICILAPDAKDSASLATDTSGSHYFAARETDANIIQLDSHSPTNARTQNEKFLFYRGVASFATPLRVTMKSDDAVTLTNTGAETLFHLFVLDVKDKSGGFIYIARLLPGEEKTVARIIPNAFRSPADLNAKIASSMTQALVKEGLYPREATAMVNTWKSSWFAEDGTRVFYVLPRAWTDRTLPMSLNPSPRELTRVMVGRAEVLTPGLEQNLTDQLEGVRRHDPLAPAELRKTARSLGRFAEPAYYRAIEKVRTAPGEQAMLADAFFDTNVSGKKGTDFE